MEPNAELRRWTEDQVCRLRPDRAGAPHWQALAVEASHRRFYRLRIGADHSLVVMSSPPSLENNTQFVTLATLLRNHGIGVPELLARDETRGFFLMSDLGDRHFADVYAGPGPQAVLPAALDTLHRLQQITDPRIPPYTAARFRDELGIYATWCLERWLDTAPPPALADAFETLLAATQRQPRCCVHRDFHSRNLLLTPAGAVGVVDFQDALVGPATYDLASLLRDCYYHMPEPAVAHWRDTYLAATSLDVDRRTFARDLDFTALQRQLKAVGIFARLHLRDRRGSHLRHIVPVLERIRDLAAVYAELESLAEHVDSVLPAARARMTAGAPEHGQHRAQPPEAGP